MGTCQECGKKNTTIFKGKCYRCRLLSYPYKEPKVKDIFKDILKK